MIQNLMQNYELLNNFLFESEQNKQQTVSISKSIFDKMNGNQMFQDKELRFPNYKPKTDLENKSIKKLQINQCFIQQVNLRQQRNLVTYKLQYIQKQQKSSINKQQILLKQLQQEMNQIKVFIDKGYLYFSFDIYVNQDSTILHLEQLVNNKKTIILDTIQKYEQQQSSYQIESQGSIFNNMKQNIIQNQPVIKSNQLFHYYTVVLLKQLRIVKSIPQTKTLVMQIIGQNNLYKVQFRDSIEIDKSLLLLIQNGDLLNLERKINALLNSLDIKIQETVSKLFLQIYMESSFQRYYQFLEFQKLSEYFNRQSQLLDTFEIRIQLLIQILCAYLLKNQLNLDSGFLQKDVILIDSKKQIKLNMLTYLKYISCKSNQLEQTEERQELLNYFEFLFPNREKQIFIDNHNITNKLQNMKEIIKNNEINFNALILQLIQIENLITQWVGFQNSIAL